MPTDSERALAIFVDFDNIAQGFRRTDRFDIQRVLKRMVEKGKIVAKKTYADWSRYLQYTASLHEAAFELVEIPKRSLTGKNSADIRLCVDAMDLAYNKTHIDTFVIVSGDSDFTPLVSKLKEMGKHVIGLGMMNSTSDLLRDNCDEFIYYEDLEVEKAEVAKVAIPPGPDTKRKAFELLLEACVALRRENKEVLWASLLKETMKRKKPSFNETYHGFNTFSLLLEAAQAEGLVSLERDEKRGTYSVVRFGDELEAGTGVGPAVKKEMSRGRVREPLPPVAPKPPLRGLPSRAPAKPATRTERPAFGEKPTYRDKPAFGDKPAFTEKPAAPRAPAAMMPPAMDEEIKPREQRFQGFSDFAMETTAFLGPRKQTTFEEEFPNFGTPQRSAIGSTAEEVMANINEHRTETRKSHDKPLAKHAVEEPVEQEQPDIKHDDDADRYKKKRRRGTGKGKEQTASEPEAAPVGFRDEGPISFDDVPFNAPSSRPVQPPRPVDPPDFDLFSPTPKEKPKPIVVKPEKSLARQIFEEIQPAEQEQPAPAVPAAIEPPKQAKPVEEPRGFGFGIFDE